MKCKLEDIAEFNPKESIKKGTITKKVSMDKLQPFCRDIYAYEVTEFKGGTKFKNGDTIMARITPCLENGKVAKVNILDEGEIGFGSTEYIVLRAKPNITDEDFLYYLVCSPLVREPAIKSMVGSSGRQRVQTDVMRQLELEIPSYSEQVKIGKILKSIDDKIEVNNEINKNLAQQAQAIFNDIFPNISNGSAYIGDYITPKRGKGLLSKDAIRGNIPVIAGGLEPSTYHNVPNTQPPVLAISASGANAGYVSLWNIPIWSSDSSYIDSTMTDDVYFWYTLLKARQEEIFDAQTGSAQPHIYPKHIAAMPIAKLKKDDISKFTKFVTPLFITIGQNKEQNSRLATLRDTLLPHLLTGKINVSDIDG